MPEMTFTVAWPDGTLDACYSPSLVVHDHLREGEAYPVADFVRRTSAAMDEASERVRARFGFACTSAMATRAHVRDRAAGHDPRALVRVVSLQPPLPGGAS